MTSVTTDRRLGLSSSVAMKAPVRTYTTAAITLSGEQTVNGTALLSGDRCLVKNQTSALDNGIYVVSTSAWQRDLDFDGTKDVVNGTLVPSYDGLNTYALFALSTVNPVIGTSLLTFEQVDSINLAADLASPLDGLGDALVAVKATGGVARTQHDKNLDFVTFEDFGAVGDGSTDDTTSVAAALSARSGKAIYANSTSYKITSQLTIPANTSIKSAGRFSSKFLKSFNGDFATMAGGVTLTNVNVDANSTTGKGFIVTGNNQSLTNCRLNGFADYCVHFSVAGSGSNFKMIGGEATRVSASDPSFGFPVTDVAGTPRYFKGVSTGGGVFGDMNNATDTVIENCFIRDLNWNDNQGITLITGCRFAALAGDVHIKGGGHVLTGNSIAATNIYLDSGTNGVYIRGNGGYGTVIDNSGQTLNSYEYPRKTYTPVWNQPSGTQPALGDGTITGNTVRDGQVCTLNILLTMGSTTTFGNNTTSYQFSLPHQVYSQGRHVGLAFITDASTGLTTTYNVTFNAGTSIATISNMSGGGVRLGSPITWAVSDTILITGTYLCD